MPRRFKKIEEDFRSFKETFTDFRVFQGGFNVTPECFPTKSSWLPVLFNLSRNAPDRNFMPLGRPQPKPESLFLITVGRQNVLMQMNNLFTRPAIPTLVAAHCIRINGEKPQTPKRLKVIILCGLGLRWRNIAEKTVLSKESTARSLHKNYLKIGSV